MLREFAVLRELLALVLATPPPAPEAETEPEARRLATAANVSRSEAADGDSWLAEVAPPGLEAVLLVRLGADLSLEAGIEVRSAAARSHGSEDRSGTLTLTLVSLIVSVITTCKHGAH